MDVNIYAYLHAVLRLSKSCICPVRNSLSWAGSLRCSNVRSLSEIPLRIDGTRAKKYSSLITSPRSRTLFLISLMSMWVCLTTSSLLDMFVYVACRLVGGV